MAAFREGNVVRLREEGWCVLCCSARSTMPLVNSLAAIGLQVWTPVGMVLRKVPRRKTMRLRRAPLMEGFVFARGRHKGELVGLADTASHDVRFRIFYGAEGDPAIVTDKEIERLRTAEIEAAPKDMKPKFEAGQGVRFGDSSFAGIEAEVERMKGKFACMQLGPFKVKAAPALLRNAA